METATILTKEKEQFQVEQNQLLQTLLDLRYFNPWRGISSVPMENGLKNDTSLELYITNKCNQSCEYCYLSNPELYPESCNNPEDIIANLRTFLDYCIANNFHIPLVDIFSGEIWHTQLGYDIFETLYFYLQRGLQVDRFIITSNCFFCNEDKTLQKVQQYINIFKEIGHPIVFSISIDGKIIDEQSRPRNNKLNKYTDEFYENVFTFAKINNFLFHPMISSKNVKYWIENYKWWIKQLEYYKIDILNTLMLLEVRNNDWTEESINDYCKFMKFLMDDYLHKECKDDIKIFANSIVKARQLPNDPTLQGYNPWVIFKSDSYNGCTVSNHLTVRLGDLAICPCHRQAYEQYLYGHFIVERGIITGIKAQNPAMAIRILMGNIQTMNPLCDMCVWNKYCLKGCLGSQLETNYDPFFPITSVCNFFKKKYSFIMQYYRDHGVIEYLRSFSTKEYGINHVLDLLELESEERENGMGTN